MPEGRKKPFGQSWNWIQVLLCQLFTSNHSNHWTKPPRAIKARGRKKKIVTRSEKLDFSSVSVEHQNTSNNRPMKYTLPILTPDSYVVCQMARLVFFSFPSPFHTFTAALGFEPTSVSRVVPVGALNDALPTELQRRGQHNMYNQKIWVVFEPIMFQNDEPS